MMKQIALAAVAVVTLATATVSSNTQAEAKNNNGGAFLAGAIIGGATAIIAGSAYAGHGYDRPRRERGYDRPHREPSRTVCEVREQYNKWGEFLGERRVCWKERGRY
jgi:hypothetical protein